MNTVTIPSHCNGPANSGNGGYSCGILAASIDGPARVRLHVPPPLETPLEVRSGESVEVQMFAGDVLVGTAWPVDFELAIPKAPSLQQAEDASTRFPAYEEHAYATCYVCGPERRDDGLCLFPGPVDDWSLLACVWRPRAEMFDNGVIRPEIIWSALDCPGYFAAAGGEPIVTLLGELSASISEPIVSDEPLIVYSWPVGREGRKLFGGAAIASQSGTVLAASRSTWIELK